TRPIVEHFRRTRVAQWLEALDHRVTVVDQGSDGIERIVRPGSKRADQGNRQIADPATNKREQRQGVIVGPVEVIEQEQCRRWQLVKKLKGGIQPRRAGLRRRSPAGLYVNRTSEAKSSKCLVDDTERQARFGGIAPSDADSELVAPHRRRPLHHGGFPETRFTNDEQAAP